MTEFGGIGLDYDGEIVCDPSWRDEADVMMGYHGSGYATPDHRVTGILVRKVDGVWTRVH